jgi:hypothetical protein
VPTIVRGEGTYIYDDKGKRYLDGLAGLFVVQVGHGRTGAGGGRAKQAQELAFFPIWSYAHPKAVELAERLANYAPGDLNKVFFTTGGGEAVESAWKLAKQYFKLTGKPTKHKVISRAVAYHGTPHGRPVDHRSAGPEGRLRAAGPVGDPRSRTPTSTGRPPLLDQRDRRRPRGVRPVGRRPDRGGDPLRGRGHRGRRLPGAGAERGRLLPAPARLLPAGPRDLRPPRRAARLGRGHLRLRPPRHVCSAATSSATYRTSSPAPRA